jgi:hypothetical protein
VVNQIERRPVELNISALGALPGRLYCSNCHTTVTTTVHLHLPHIPL